MQKGIIGKKVGMTQVFDEKGNVVPVTVIEAGPCVVVQKKTAETDGYAAVELGFGDVSPKRVNKPLKGHFDKADVAPKKTLREFRFDNCDAFNVGDIVKADTFAPGEVWTSAAPAKAKDTPAPSNAGTSTGSRNPTVPARLPAMRVRWAPALLRPVSLRA